MKIWVWTAILFTFFDVLLITSYFEKKSLIDQAYQELGKSPGMEDYQAISRRAIMEFIWYGSSDSLNNRFVDASENLDKILGSLNPDTIPQEEIFEKKNGIPSNIQDSLWNGFQRYRKYLDEVLKDVLEEQRYYRSRFVAASGIVKSHNNNKGKNKMLEKRLQASLDSTTQFSWRTYKVSLEDTIQTRNLLSFLEIRSNPAEELRMTTALQKLDNLFVSLGTVQWYGKYIKLGELTGAERLILCRKAIMLKAEANRQLAHMKYIR